MRFEIEVSPRATATDAPAPRPAADTSCAPAGPAADTGCGPAGPAAIDTSCVESPAASPRLSPLAV